MKTKIHKDKVGSTLEKFDEVYVPEPTGSDIHNFEFTGMIDGFRKNNAIVSDQEGNTFEIECHRLIKAD